MNEEKLAAAIAASILTLTEIGTQPKPSPAMEALTRGHILAAFMGYLEALQKVV